MGSETLILLCIAIICNAIHCMHLQIQISKLREEVDKFKYHYWIKEEIYLTEEE